MRAAAWVRAQMCSFELGAKGSLQVHSVNATTKGEVESRDRQGAPTFRETPWLDFYMYGLRVAKGDFSRRDVIVGHDGYLGIHVRFVPYRPSTQRSSIALQTSPVLPKPILWPIRGHPQLPTKTPWRQWYICCAQSGAHASKEVALLLPQRIRTLLTHTPESEE